MPKFLSSPLHRLRLLGRLEGLTLLILLLIAVPLRHAGGLPIATKIMGPIHGLIFVLYVAALIDTISGGGWTKREAFRAALAALLPFGTLANDSMIRAKIARSVGRA